MQNSFLKSAQFKHPSIHFKSNNNQIQSILP